MKTALAMVLSATAALLLGCNTTNASLGEGGASTDSDGSSHSEHKADSIHGADADISDDTHESTGEGTDIATDSIADDSESIDENPSTAAGLLFAEEKRADATACQFVVTSAVLSPWLGSFELAAHGDDATARTVVGLASQLNDMGKNVVAALNGGYFGAGFGPYSYAKGHFGYDSKSMVAKGPRSCLLYDASTHAARIELSMGRDGSGSLHLDMSDVLCAGPRLVQDGVDVSASAFVAEHFETSGIGKDARLPRSGLCLMQDGAIALIAAQSETVRACGFTLSEFASYMIERGCVQGMSLDGGGSTALWFNDGINKSHNDGIENRPVYQALVIHRR